MPGPERYPQLFDPGFAEQASQVYARMAAEREARRPQPAPPPPPENSMLTDIGHGLARGVMVTAPEMVGQAMQAFGADDTGKAMADAAKKRGEDELYRTTGLTGQVASMLPSALGVAATALIPGVGEVTTPVIGGSLLAELSGAALFGGSQYTATREKGGTVGQAAAAGAIQAASGGIGGAVGGRIVTGAANTLKKSAVDRSFKAFSDPSLWGTMGRGLLHAEAVQLPTQAAAMGGVAAVESGLPDTPTPWEAAKQSFAPTALLTAAMAPFGAPAIMRTNKQRAVLAATVRNPDLSFKERTDATRAIARQLREVDAETANAWELEANTAISLGQIPEIRPGYEYGKPENVPPPPTEPTPSDWLPPTNMFNQLRATSERGEYKPYPHGEVDANLTWQKLLADRELEQQGEAHTTLTNQLVNNPPPGVIPFSAWVTAQRDMKQGPLAVGGRINEAGLKDAYIAYVNDAIQQQKRPEVPLDQRGQGALDFRARPEMQLEPSPRETMGRPEFQLEPGPREEGGAPQQGELELSSREEGGAPQQRELGLDSLGPAQNRPSYDPTRTPETAAEVAARLEAARNEEPPGQGTARALGLIPSVIPGEAPSAAAVAHARQSKLAALQEALPGLPKQLHTMLLGVDAQHLPEALREIWHRRKGEAGPAYNEQIAKLYKQLTGREIGAVEVQTPLEKLNEAETAAQASARAESESAALAARSQAAVDVEQAARAARDAESGVVTGEAAGQGEAQVGPAGTGVKVPPGGGVHDTRTGEPGKGAPGREPPSDEGGGPPVQGPPKVPPSDEGGGGAPLPSDAAARVRQQNETAEQLRMESQWQRLMGGEHEKVAPEITPEDARAHLDRLNAAPGDNPQARAMLERIAGVERGTVAPELKPGEQVPYGDYSKVPPSQAELDAMLAAGTITESDVRPDGTLSAAAAKRAYEVERAKLEVARERAGPPMTAEEREARTAEVTAAQAREDEARAAFREAAPELHEVRARLAELTATANELQNLRQQYKRSLELKNPSQARQEERAALQKRIGEVAQKQRELDQSPEYKRELAEMQERELALSKAAEGLPERKELSDAVGATERALQYGAREAAVDPTYYSFTLGLNPNDGMGVGSNMQRVFNYIEASKYAGEGRIAALRKLLPTKELRATFDRLTQGGAAEHFGVDTGLSAQSPKVKAAAKEAMASVDAATHRQFAEYIGQLVRSIDTAARVNEPAITAAKKYADAVRQSAKLHAAFDLENARIAAAVDAGTITKMTGQTLMSRNERLREGAEIAADQAEKLATEMYTANFDTLERNLAAADAENTGLAAFNNALLARKVVATPHATDVAAHLGRVHHNGWVRAVAKILAAGKPTASIKVIENPDFNGARYVPKTDTIEVGRGGMNTTTMLHEITHALAHAGITRALANINRLGLSPQHVREVEAIKKVQDIMKKFTEIADPGDPAHMHALKDEHEFLSESLNNPDIQRLLGAKGWLTRMFNAVRDLVSDKFGLGKRELSDFEELMKAAPVLFGNPNRSLDVVYRNPVNYAQRNDPFTSAVAAIRQLSGFDYLNRKTEQWGLGKYVREQQLATTSLQQQGRMMGSHMDRAAREYTQHAGLFEKIKNTYGEFREHLGDRGGVHSLITTESDGIAKRALQLRGTNRQAFDAMGEMGTEATRLRIDASAKTFAEAQRRNPSLTIEEWNSADAQRLRAEYKRLEGVSAQLRSRHGPDAATPISTYHEMVDHHDLQFTRSTAENVSMMLQTYGMHLVPEMKPILEQLSTRTQAGNGPGDVPTKQQQIALDRGMTQAMTKVREIRDAEFAAGGRKSVGWLDADSLLQIMEQSYTNYSQQRQVPYMHIGRAGDHMVMFTVKGGDAEWKMISDIVNKSLKDGGLERSMGPPHKDIRRVYMKFDNISHYKEAADLLRPFVGRGVIHEWADGAIDEKIRGLDSATPEFVRAFRDRINASDHIPEDMKKDVINQLFDTHLQQLPDNSPVKSSATRDGLTGYSTDYIQSFTDRSQQSAQAISRLRSSARIANTMKEMGNNMKELREAVDVPPDVKALVGEYTTDFRRRVDELNRPVASPVLDRVRAAPAIWRLALTPAYTATLMFQPWQITMPILGSKFGYVNALGSMSKNVGLSMAILGKLGKMGWLDSEGVSNFTKAASLSNLKLEFSKLTKKDGSALLTPNQLDLLSHINWQNVFNIGHTNQVARIDPEARFAGSKAFSVLSIFPHAAELQNRLIAALSTHELAMKQAEKQGLRGEALAEAHAKAKDLAVQVIRDSDGDHSQANIARNLGKHGFAGKYTPLVVGFQRFFIFQTEMMMHQLVTLKTGTKAEKVEAAKMLAGVTGMTGLMAGALGLPFMGLATAIANSVAGMFSDPNDTPPDAQLAVRRFLGSLVGGGKFGGAGASGSWGNKAEEVLARGLPRLADIDMSGRAGLQDMAPFTPFLADRRKLEDAIKDHGFNFLGPAVGMGAGIATGFTAAMQGDWPKAINDGLPSALRGFAKAYRQANYGYETEGVNNRIPIAAPSAWNLLAQTGGFTAGHRAEQSEMAFHYATSQQLLQRRQQEIRNRIYRAYNQQDWTEVSRLMEENAHFVMKHTQFNANISSGLRQQAVSRKVGEVTGTGVLGKKKDIRLLGEMYPQMQQLQ